MKNIEYFVTEIEGLGMKSVEGILKYGMTMLDAKTTLDSSDFERFLERMLN